MSGASCRSDFKAPSLTSLLLEAACQARRFFGIIPACYLEASLCYFLAGGRFLPETAVIFDVGFALSLSRTFKRLIVSS